MDSKAWSQLAAQTALDKRATNVVILDLQKLTIVCDYFVICTVRNPLQAKAVAEGLLEKRHETGRAPNHIEGLATGSWVLMDYGDVIVHVFMPEERSFYDLERLWADAKAEQLEEVVADLRQMRQS